jgi:hypothetical protein
MKGGNCPRIGSCQTDRRLAIRLVGSSFRVWRISQPCFLAVDRTEGITAKSLAPSSERKPPEIFCRSFIIRPSRSARLLVNGTSGSVRKPSTSCLCVQRRSSRLWRRVVAADLVAWSWSGRAVLHGMPVRRRQWRRNAVRSGQSVAASAALRVHVRGHGMAGTPRQPLHPARPVLLLDLDQRLQFAQVVGVAQRM